MRSDAQYGSLSRRAIDEMNQGEGVEGADRKEDPLDFALWKAHKDGEDTVWFAPWGRGRPGWHIECSAMAEEQLGVGFQIHGGGNDLVFPHHENEAAQTRMARDAELAQIWMHNGMLQFGEEKMAKSVGNVMALHEVLDDVGRNALIMLFMGAHYRQPMAFDDMRLMEALARVARVRDAARGLVDGESPADMRHLRDAFFEALRQDFNTPAALAAMFDWISERHKHRRAGRPRRPRRDAVRAGAARTSPSTAARRAPRSRSCSSSARRRARPATTPRPTACATSCATAAGRCATGRADRSSCASSSDPLRPQPRARGAAGGAPARWGRSGRPSASLAREPWLRQAGARVTGAQEIERRAGSPDHQGVCAEAGGYPYVSGGELLMRDDPFIVALDELQDPQNLGAIARSAECAGVSGLVICERRAAAVTPAVAKASAGAVEHLRIARVRNMADFLGAGQGGRRVVLRRRRRRRHALRRAGLHRRGRARHGRRGKRACARAWRSPATRSSRCRCAAARSR